MALQDLSDWRETRSPSQRLCLRRLFSVLLQLAGTAFVLGAAAALALGTLGPVKYNYDAFAHLRLQFSIAAFLGAALIAWGGAWRCAFAASLVGVAGLIGLGPAWSAPVAAAEECVVARLSVATANVHDKNADFDKVVDALLVADADVLATQESVARFWSASRRLRSRYPYRLTHIPKKGRTRSVMLWSKKPLKNQSINSPGAEAPGLAVAEIALAGRRVVVAGLHGGRPVLAPQRSQYEGLEKVFAQAPPRRIIVGDFNATLWSHGMATAERSLGARAVSGYRVTWRGEYPNPIWRRKGWKPPAIIGNQIDHVLVSKQFGVESVETFELPGSVHRGVKAVLQLKSDALSCR